MCNGLTASELYQQLKESSHTLALHNGETHFYDERGVADLFRLVTKTPELLKGAIVADKVVGKAAAALMITGKIAELHTHVVSRPALHLLSTSDIKHSYDILTDQIRNRTNTGFCPMESLCLECNTAEECFDKIKEKLASKKG